MLKEEAWIGNAIRRGDTILPHAIKAPKRWNGMCDTLVYLPEGGGGRLNREEALRRPVVAAKWCLFQSYLTRDNLGN